MFFKKFKLGLLFIGVLLVAVSCSKGEDKTLETVKEVESKKSSVPTLFIHGYSGTKNSFGGMIRRADKYDEGTRELVLGVSPEGEVSQKGELSKKENNPTVQVIFENNEADEWSQADWIKNCLVFLKDNYGAKSVNVVAHSMGGSSTFRYLVDYAKSDLPVIEKFVAIGTPFNNFVTLQKGETLDGIIENGPSLKSDRYKSYEKGISKVPKDMKVLLVAGDIEDGSLGDSAVPMVDALSVVSLFKSNGNAVSYKEYYGKAAQHSRLHENDEVDDLVFEFLWK